MRRPRHLSPDERALWDIVARRATPLAKRAEASVPVLPKTDNPARQAAQRATFDPFHIGERSKKAAHGHDLSPPLSHTLAAAPVRMDSKSFGKMKRGKLRPEDRIDLHGMTLAEAHPALVSFILSAHAAQKRLVLVITGKGKERDGSGPIPTPIGVLRHQVPRWLSHAPLRGAILQVTPAHIRHGGDGAYYVYLRRDR